MFLFVIIFILGASIASFLNVVAKALASHSTWHNRRSACPKCHTTLHPAQLMPVFSYIFLKGRCCHCKTKIPIIYFLVEIIGGSAFLISFSLNPVSPQDIITSWIFLSMLLISALTDIYGLLIPNKMLLVFAPFLLINNPNIIGFIIAFLFFNSTFLLGKLIFKKETIGGGDIKLYMLIGLFLPTYYLFVAVLISSAAALLYLIITKKQNEIPFAPFIAIGSCLAYIISNI